MLYGCCSYEAKEFRFDVASGMMLLQDFPILTPRGVLPYQEVGGGEGGLHLASSLEAKFGARFSQVHQIRGKIWGVLLLHTTRKNWERITILGAFAVISEIQRAKFGVSVTYIFGGKIWGSDMNFKGKVWGQAPQPPNMEVAPLGFNLGIQFPLTGRSMMLLLLKNTIF